MEELLEVPLAPMIAGETLEGTTAPDGTAMPAFRHEEHLIFGATARVVDGLMRLLRAAPGSSERR